MLDALRKHQELDMNDLTFAALQARPALPETPVGNVQDMIAVVEELLSENIIEELPSGSGARRYRLKDASHEER
jgi:hypothetical protein